MWRDNLAQHVARNDAGFPPEYLAVAKEHHGGHPLDLVGLGGPGIAVHINLQNSDTVTHLFGEFFNDGSHHLAGTAPVSIEIDKHGLVSIDDLAEGLFIVVHKTEY